VAVHLLPHPPADIADRDLPIQVVPAGATLRRIHPSASGPIFFGPGTARPPTYRFDDPLGQYGVCYLGGSALAAFVETFLRDLSTLVISEANLAYRNISRIEVVRDLRLVKAHSEGLFQLGSTAAVGGAKIELPRAASADAYAHSQAWSRTLHDHRDAPDGIAFHSSHDDSLECFALFEDRAVDAIMPGARPRRVSTQRALLAKAVRRYNLVLLPAITVGGGGGPPAAP
jgi:hypothetical protein